MEEEMKPQKKRRGRVWLCILLALLLVIGVALFLVRRWLSLGHYILTTTPEAVQSDKAENDKKTNELLHQLIPDVTMRDLTEEERAMLASGALSYEDALKLIRGETLAPAETVLPETADVPVETTVPEETTAVSAVTTAPEVPVTTAPPKVPAVTTAKTTAKEPELDLAATLRRQEEIIAEIYLLRATYLNEIDALIQGMKDTYDALPKERKNLQSKIRIAERTMPKGYALEDECDAKMEALLTELTGILQVQALSTDIVDEIRKTYEEQKELKLAELYNQYGSKLEK